MQMFGQESVKNMRDLAENCRKNATEGNNRIACGVRSVRTTERHR